MRQQELLRRAQALLGKTAVGPLWKYTCPDTGNVFFLLERKISGVRSPWTGKPFVAKPERSTLTDVAKDLRTPEVAPEQAGTLSESDLAPGLKIIQIAHPEYGVWTVLRKYEGVMYATERVWEIRRDGRPGDVTTLFVSELHFWRRA